MSSSRKHIYRVSPRKSIEGFAFYLVPLKGLSPHEEVMQDLKKELMKRMSSDNVLKDPIIADYSKGLIIDGTHRAAVLKEMNIDYVVIQHFNYMDPELKLYRWFRLYRDIEELPHEISKMLIQKDVFGIGEMEKYPLYIVYRGVLTVLSQDINVKKVMDGMREVESIFRRYGYNNDFISEDEVFMGRGIGERDVLLGYRYITKKEVLDLHRKGCVLNHKSTRHVPPYRVIGIDIPIDYLTADNIDKAVEYLKEITLEYVGEKIVVDERYYAEKVFKRKKID